MGVRASKMSQRLNSLVTPHHPVVAEPTPHVDHSFPWQKRHLWLPSFRLVAPLGYSQSAIFAVPMKSMHDGCCRRNVRPHHIRHRFLDPPLKTQLTAVLAPSPEFVPLRPKAHQCSPVYPCVANLLQRDALHHLNRKHRDTVGVLEPEANEHVAITEQLLPHLIKDGARVDFEETEKPSLRGYWP